MEIGGTSERFWDLTIGEIGAEIEAFDKRRKLNIIDIYTQASLTTRGISCLFSEESTFPTLDELLQVEKVEDLEQKKKYAQFQSEIAYFEMLKVKEQINKEKEE